MSIQDFYRVVLRSSQVDQRRLQYARYVSWVLIPVLAVFPIFNSFDYSGMVAVGYIAALGAILIANLLISSTSWVWGLISLTAAAIGLLYFVYLGYGDGGSLLWIYAFPLAVIFLTGVLWGALASILTVITAVLIMTLGTGYGAYNYGAEFTARFAISYLVIAAMASGFEFWRIAIETQKEVLEGALNQTRDALKNFTSVCAWCNSIQDEDGSWQTVQDYVERKESARISHSICPNCQVKELSPSDEQT